MVVVVVVVRVVVVVVLLVVVVVLNVVVVVIVVVVGLAVVVVVVVFVVVAIREPSDPGTASKLLKSPPVNPTPLLGTVGRTVGRKGVVANIVESSSSSGSGRVVVTTNCCRPSCCESNATGGGGGVLTLKTAGKDMSSLLLLNSWLPGSLGSWASRLAMKGRSSGSRPLLLVTITGGFSLLMTLSSGSILIYF